MTFPVLTQRSPVSTARKSRPAGDRTALAGWTIVALGLLLLLTTIGSITTGPSSVSFKAVGDYLTYLAGFGDIGSRERVIIEAVRLPRSAMGIMVGASLAVTGAVMQGLFRNPLADPGIIGVSSGAGLGAVSMIVLGGTTLAPVRQALGSYDIPLAAFFGALVVTLILYRLATRGGQTSIATLLLGGIAIGALAGAATGLLVFAADDAQLRTLTFWGLGSLAGATGTKVATIAPIIIAALAATPFLARGLNALALGEPVAGHIGISVQRFKNLAIVVVALATGASVAVSGGIGFVGVVVPHMLRLAIGPDNRYLLPASALLGASLLLACDAVSRTVVAPAELPIGIVTAIVGTPVFLWILMRRGGWTDL